ncbi:Rec8 like protein-domain-containing protein [Aspergillus avenaceus]|uniref:Rec8 like protein-domain-containing protein n=1 Tax=Aspergillus avenaceus TaxID=36643 RepID=A0A5N6TKA5_ASPAV|nr:Rec8 like protein-domain-containing protein [Aspergillus avenaceus]
MFYSHEILTSPEHGVATIWLVATLGSKSISRKLNRKTILDVDVPRACNVIMDPEAPMALRLQGNLLYGVSRVFSQQCGYTLTDVQAMHDKMRTMLKILPGGGLDPTAGKARPDQLILPYDPSFLPEQDLSGLGLNLSKLSLPTETSASQQSSLLWPRTPDLSQSALSQGSSLRLNISVGDIILNDAGGFGSGTNVASSVVQGYDLIGLASRVLNEESGVLLQPDFEFDADGNLIELQRPASEDTARNRSEDARASEARDGLNDLSFDQRMLVGDDVELAVEPNTHRPHTGRLAAEKQLNVSESEDELQTDKGKAMHRTRRAKTYPLDERTSLRNRDLASMNNDYVLNMAGISKQKHQNKLSAQAKKNAASWVYGRGIGSVGLGIGTSNAPHPLQQFSGEELWNTLNQTTRPKKRKRGHLDEDNDASDARRVRAREEELGPGIVDDDIWRDVEIGRQAPSVQWDDNSSQMPWNITASIQSSKHASSAASALRGATRMSDLPSRGIAELASRGRDRTTGQRPRSRRTSASPLAGRGFPFDVDSLAIPGNDDIDGDFDLSQYLQTELFSGDTGHADAGPSMNESLEDKILRSQLNQENLNFLGFLNTRLENLSINDDREIRFSDLLPPAETAKSVATHGLMHVLSLATKSLIAVRQDEYIDRSTQYHARYDYGEIFLSLTNSNI